MSMVWTCDATRATAERYASLKFRRFARVFRADRLDYADGCELAAFLRTVEISQARYIFQWTPLAVSNAKVVVTHLANDANVAVMAEENLRDQTRDDGLAVLRAMQDGGWKAGTLPPVVRMAMLDMRDAGMSQERVAEVLGLTREQIRTVTVGPRASRRGRRLGDGGFIAL